MNHRHETIRRLETNLGIRLLTRTTRRVAPTEAGERLLKTLAPALDDIAGELSSVREMRDKPAGTIRITASEHATTTTLWPALEKFLLSYPDIHVEIDLDFGFTDIVADRFDWKSLCLGIAERPPRDEDPGRRFAGLQQRADDRACRRGRVRPRLRAMELKGMEPADKTLRLGDRHAPDKNAEIGLEVTFHPVTLRDDEGSLVDFA
jgi:DNA-binding transcriptional LysR family regulator